MKVRPFSGLNSRIIATIIAVACVFATNSRAEVAPLANCVLRVGFTVDDMDRSVEFYTSVLDFKKISDDELAGEELETRLSVFGARIHVVRLKLGDEILELTEYLAANQRGRLIPRDSRSNDRWFQHIAIVTTDIERAYQRLREHKVRHASTGPQRLPGWNKNAAGIAAFYFLDPDGHVLEIIQFPHGKGDPKWQDRPELLLGVDHTAIVVANTEQSLSYYRDLLGFKIVGGSENYGPEQAHLNNVPGAHLRITTLAAPGAGPKIELLQYLQPDDGRPFPPDAKPNDLFHWQTTIATSSARTGLIRDPDGHALLFAKD